MKENTKSPLDRFQQIVEENHNKAKMTINRTLINEIQNAALMLSKTDNKELRKEIVENLLERFKNEDLNQVTEIFIYSQCYWSTNEDPIPIQSRLCISLGKLFTESNLYYTASKIYTEESVRDSCALKFLIYLAYHVQHTDYVLDFIKGNYGGLYINLKTECVFALKESLPDNEIAQQIIRDSGITKYSLTFNTIDDTRSKPIKFKLKSSDQVSKKDSESAFNLRFQHQKPSHPGGNFGKMTDEVEV